MSDLSDGPSVSGWILEEIVGPNTKLRQGDLIRFESDDNDLRRTGIIVTADCDLEQKKHARLVTMIPIVTTQVILENYLLVEDCEKKRALIESYVFKKLDIDERQDRETKLSILGTITRDHLLERGELVLTATEFVLDTLGSIKVIFYKKLMEAIDINPRKANALQDQIRNRGDLLVLPDAQRLGVVGEIAWIRHVWQVRLSDIAIRTSEVRSRPGERLARLDSPYRYRLTQLMAQVFSDIGLPSTTDQIEHIVQEAYNNV